MLAELRYDNNSLPHACVAHGVCDEHGDVRAVCSRISSMTERRMFLRGNPPRRPGRLTTGEKQASV
jgi:hypothetical protein